MAIVGFAMVAADVERGLSFRRMRFMDSIPA
jgi:hypothetical protein